MASDIERRMVDQVDRLSETLIERNAEIKRLRDALNLLAPVVQWLVDNYPAAWERMPTDLFRDFQRAADLAHTESDTYTP